VSTRRRPRHFDRSPAASGMAAPGSISWKTTNGSGVRWCPGSRPPRFEVRLASPCNGRIRRRTTRPSAQPVPIGGGASAVTTAVPRHGRLAQRVDESTSRGDVRLALSGDQGAAAGQGRPVCYLSRLPGGECSHLQSGTSTSRITRFTASAAIGIVRLGVWETLSKQEPNRSRGA
jgi:hypothetical protein